ncbi:MAG: hypothetical protein Q7J19_07680 [Lutibacter sp.]|nr:hypothetical protein [Lutibacter sp.]
MIIDLSLEGIKDKQMKRSTLALIMIIVSSLGPYIGLGLRLEHVFIYGFFFIILILFFFKATLNKTLLYSLVPLLFSFLITIFFDLITGPKIRAASIFSNIDNLLEPVLLIFVFSYYLNKSFTENDFKILLNFIVVTAVFAGLISILTIFIDLEFILRFFVTDIQGEESLWKQVLSLGRYTGIFSQPLEAGIFFAGSIFSLIYLKKVYGIRNLYFLTAFFVIFIAGSISLSKNFYLLGLVMTFFLYGQLSRWPLKKYLFSILMFFGALTGFFIFFNFDFGNYFNSLLGLYESEGLANAITAGRFGGSETTDVELLFNKFLNDGFFMGFGLGTHLPLDNGFLEFAYQGGFFSLLGYLLFICYGLYIGLIHYKKAPAKFLLILMVYVLLSSIGGPVITANRANIIFIFLICATLVLSNKTSTLFEKKENTP